jgi:hypothetical protein
MRRKLSGRLDSALIRVRIHGRAYPISFVTVKARISVQVDYSRTSSLCNLTNT